MDCEMEFQAFPCLDRMWLIFLATRHCLPWSLPPMLAHLLFCRGLPAPLFRVPYTLIGLAPHLLSANSRLISAGSLLRSFISPATCGRGHISHHFHFDTEGSPVENSTFRFDILFSLFFLAFSLLLCYFYPVRYNGLSNAVNPRDNFVSVFSFGVCFDTVQS